MFSLSETYDPPGPAVETDPSAGGSPSDKQYMASSMQNADPTVTISWLAETYECFENGHIARESIYSHYCDYMTGQGLPTMNAASFGKTIRSVFPKITTRRLGTRGNSKYMIQRLDHSLTASARYHYYGIQVKGCQPAASDSLVAAGGADVNSLDHHHHHHHHHTASLAGAKRDSSNRGGSSSRGPYNKQSSSSSAASFPAPKETAVHRPQPSAELLNDLLRFPLPDYSKFPMGVNIERVADFLRLYRDHSELLLKQGLQGQFDTVSPCATGVSFGDPFSLRVPRVSTFLCPRVLTFLCSHVSTAFSFCTLVWLTVYHFMYLCG